MSRVLYIRFLMRSFLSELKNDSATALSQQLPRRIILGARLLTRQNRRQSSLPYWLPWSLWNITPAGLPQVSHAISSALMVSLLSGEKDIAHPTAFLANRSSKLSPTLSCPDIRHVAAPHLIRLCYCKVSLKVIRDSYVFMSTTSIPVGG